MNDEVNQSDLSRLKIDWKRPAPGASPRRSRKVIWISLLLIGIAVVTLGIFRLGRAPKLVEITTVTTVQPSQSVSFLNASGYVVAQRRASVASKGTGRLVELRAREGDLVKKGDLIGLLESADVEAGLARAKANLNVSRSGREEAKAALNDAALNYDRKKSLLETELVPRADFDAAEARYRRAEALLASADAGIRAAEATVRAAEVDVENTRIRAPFDGTILTKNAEVGEVVAPFASSVQAKSAVVTIADMSSLEVEADVSESNIEKVKVGQKAEITLDAYPETKYEGVVQTIVPTADRAKATILTKIRFLNRDTRVLPEMSARVAFFPEARADQTGKSLIAVAPSAVVSRGDRKVAFRIREDRGKSRVEEIPVEVGDPLGGAVEIKKGLSSGDRVVIHSPADLQGGDRVQVK